MMKLSKKLQALTLAAAFAVMPLSAYAAQSEGTIELKTMGSLLFGGTVTQLPGGGTFHGDHGYAQYYVPEDARTYPLIMWHGMGQSGRSWESTPDGREGYQALLTRDDWAVYIVDQPRRGRAGYTHAEQADPGKHPTSASEGGVWEAFRNGIWQPGEKATVYENSQFPLTPDAVDQFFRQQTFNTGVEPATTEHYKFLGKTMSALVEETGPAVLVTHSMSGKYGWFSAMATDKIKAVVAYEPGQVVLPENAEIPQLPYKSALAYEMLQPITVPEAEFNKLTKIPILIIYGDNIATEPSEIFNVDVWRLSKAYAEAFVKEVNARGGDATLVSLPDLGIKGNTHVPFADKNNIEIANLMENWLHQKGLDGKENPHTGPQPKGLTEFTIPIAQ